MSEIEKLRAKEAQIKKRIAEIQSRHKSLDRKQRTARLIRWGVCVEHMLKSGKIEPAEWVEVCREVLSVRDFELATSEIHSTVSTVAHIKLSTPAGQIACAPAAGGSE